MSYELRDYESVDEKSQSQAMSRNTNRENIKRAEAQPCSAITNAILIACVYCAIAHSKVAAINCSCKSN